MRQETQPEIQNKKEAVKASFFKDEVLTTVQEEAFIKSSKAKTAGQFTVIQAPHYILSGGCEGNLFTILKTVDVGNIQNLGSVCELCNAKFNLTRHNLPFTLNHAEIERIEAQTKFEIDFEKKLNQILDLLKKPKKQNRPRAKIGF